MKKIILFIGLICFYNFSHASHIYGGQISLKDLGSSSYEVEIQLWVDTLAPVSNTIQYDYYSSTANVGTAFLSNTINLGNGIVELVYMDTAGINFIANQLIVSYSNCCRNAAITNVVNPSSADFFIQTTLNFSGGANTSPKMMNPPKFYHGVGDTLNHNPMAVEPDGDSLVYSLITPWGAATVPLTMTTNPYPSAPASAFSIDASIGNIFWIPSSTGVYSYAVQVDEYRNGNLISTSIRDALIHICTGCKTQMSSDFSFDKSSWTYVNGYPSWDLYETIPFTLTVLGSVSSANNNILELNFLTQADMFSPSPAFAAAQVGSQVGGTFMWTPAVGQARSNPYAGVLVGREINYANQMQTKEQSVLLNVMEKPSSIADPDIQILNLYPNPVGDRLFLQTVNLPGMAEMKILAMDGRMVYRTILQKGSNGVILETRSLPNGMYIVQMQMPTGIISKRFQVIH